MLHCGGTCVDAHGCAEQKCSGRRVKRGLASSLLAVSGMQNVAAKLCDRDWWKERTSTGANSSMEEAKIVVRLVHYLDI